MSKKRTILEPAVKEKNGKVDPAPSKAWSHDQLEAATGLKKKNVKIDAAYVTKQLAEIAKNQDLSRYIL